MSIHRAFWSCRNGEGGHQSGKNAQKCGPHRFDSSGGSQVVRGVLQNLRQGAATRSETGLTYSKPCAENGEVR